MASLTPAVRKVCQNAIVALADASRICLEIRGNLTPDMISKKTNGDILSAAEYVVQAKLTHALLNSDQTIKIPIVAEETVEMVPPDVRQKFFLRGAMLGKFSSPTELQDLIEESSHDLKKGRTAGLWWAMDAIDGTQGFTQGKQFAISLALMDGAQPIFAAVACPAWEGADPSNVVSHVFAGEKSHIPFPTRSEPLRTPSIVISSNDPNAEELLKFIHDNFGPVDWGRHFQVQKIPSQVKYLMTAVKDSSAFIRMTPDGSEYVWDHIAGAMILRGAGGSVTDCHGKDIEFSGSSVMIPSHGIIATPVGNSKFHRELVDFAMKALRHRHASAV
jgi:3'-phosphoadenosine 5'-phosphosulfate (PAPS) 3'-phosphatase